MNDWGLLRQFIDNNSQAAFAQLIDKHSKLVYWTCQRDVQDAQLAEDAAQVVFMILARKAGSLKRSL